MDCMGEIQYGFRRGRRTEDLFMLERLIEMVKWRKDNNILVHF